MLIKIISINFFKRSTICRYFDYEHIVLTTFKEIIIEFKCWVLYTTKCKFWRHETSIHARTICNK